MIPVAQIKKDLNYSLDLADIIYVLKIIASAEFRNLSSRMEKEDILKEQLTSCFNMLTPGSITSSFLAEGKDVPPAFLMICSDEGFLGEVNSVIVDMALKRGLKEGAKFIVLGERGARILSDSEIDFISFPSVKDDIKIEDAAKITDHIMDLYRKSQISSLYVVYMKFVSFTRHHVEIIKLLPFETPTSQNAISREYSSDILIEPNSYIVTEYLVKAWLEKNLYDVFWSSKLSEWSVRVMHLEHSSDELKEVNRELKFKYFKSVHALNDKVIREIFAARRLL